MTCVYKGKRSYPKYDCYLSFLSFVGLKMLKSVKIRKREMSYPTESCYKKMTENINYLANNVVFVDCEIVI